MLGGNEELGERDGIDVGKAVGVLDLLGGRDGINVGEAVGVLELVGATDVKTLHGKIPVELHVGSVGDPEYLTVLGL